MNSGTYDRRRDDLGPLDRIRSAAFGIFGGGRHPIVRKRSETDGTSHDGIYRRLQSTKISTRAVAKLILLSLVGSNRKLLDEGVPAARQEDFTAFLFA